MPVSETCGIFRTALLAQRERPPGGGREKFREALAILLGNPFGDEAILRPHLRGRVRDPVERGRASPEAPRSGMYARCT